MCNGGGVASQTMHGPQNTAALLSHISSIATLQHLQLTSIDVNTVIPTARGDAVVIRAELNFGDFRLGVASERYLAEPVVVAVRSGSVSEVVHRDRTGGGSHRNERRSLVDVAAATRGLQGGLANEHAVLRVPNHQFSVIADRGEKSVFLGHVRGQAIHRTSVEVKQLLARCNRKTGARGTRSTRARRQTTVGSATNRVPHLQADHLAIAQRDNQISRRGGHTACSSHDSNAGHYLAATTFIILICAGGVILAAHVGSTDGISGTAARTTVGVARSVLRGM
mmetsp:Transcript_23743/g.41040  ORF Transcript_23743/g.41040 Transcript_23743/m.41040 type:complete len:281 (-) Transcript_23743:2768-3610(-)